jgi:hypothetical protein
MKQQLRFILVFYQSFWGYTLAVSLGIWFFFSMPMGIAFFQALPAFIVAKLATHALVLYLLNLRYPGQRYFYTNLGVPVVRLYAVSYGVDLLLFFIPIALFHLIR